MTAADQLLGPLQIGLAGLEVSAEERDWLKHPAVGGVVLFTRNYQDLSQLTDLTASITTIAGRDLLISVDHEGGRVQRFRDGFTRLPSLNVLGKMYATPAWENVRSRNGWVNIYNPGDEFTRFLEQQEHSIKALMVELGFL